MTKKFQSVFVSEDLPPLDIEEAEGTAREINDISITLFKVSKIFKDLGAHKAIRPDEISPFVLKDVQIHQPYH